MRREKRDRMHILSFYQYVGIGLTELQVRRLTISLPDTA